MTAKAKKAQKRGPSKAAQSESERERHHMARSLALILTHEPDGPRAGEVAHHVSRLAAATGSTAADLRPEYQLAAIFKDYGRCNFKLDGTDREAARTSYDALKLLAQPQAAPADLATLLAAVVGHPDTPPGLRGRIVDSLTETAPLDELCAWPEVVRAILGTMGEKGGGDAE